MMSSGSGRNLTNPTSHDVQMLMGKFEDPDSDIRYMTLVDLCSMLTNGSPNLLLKDYNGCNRIIDGLIRLLDDSNGDVQSQALKW